MPRRARFDRDLSHYFKIDLAEIGRHAALQQIGKVHRMTWRRQRTIWVRKRGYPERVEVTNWVSARLTRIAHDKLTVLLSSKQGGPGTKLMRWRMTLTLSVRWNAVAGERQWFRCPDCGGVVRAVYWSGGWLRCWRCAGLRHTTALISPEKRADHRCKRVLRQLGLKGDAWSELPDRPHGMHRRRYRDLVQEFASAAKVTRAADNRRAARIDRGLWKMVFKLQRRIAVANIRT